jgi:hypothetical protein
MRTLGCLQTLSIWEFDRGESGFSARLYPAPHTCQIGFSAFSPSGADLTNDREEPKKSGLVLNFEASLHNRREALKTVEALLFMGSVGPST